MTFFASLLRLITALLLTTTVALAAPENPTEARAREVIQDICSRMYPQYVVSFIEAHQQSPQRAVQAREYGQAQLEKIKSQVGEGWFTIGTAVLNMAYENYPVHQREYEQTVKQLEPNTARGLLAIQSTAFCVAQLYERQLERQAK